MGFSVIRNRISITRGDSAEIRLSIRDRMTGSHLPSNGSFLMKPRWW